MACVITSTRNAVVKHIAKLRESKVVCTRRAREMSCTDRVPDLQSYRLQQNRAVICGHKLVHDVCQHLAPARVFVTPRSGDLARSLLHGCQPVVVHDHVMRKMAGVQHVDGPGTMVAEVDLPASTPQVIHSSRRLLVLDGVSDPGNVGTLVRTALALGTAARCALGVGSAIHRAVRAHVGAAGWDGLLCLPGTADLFNDKAVKASMGAAFRMPFHMCDPSALQTLVAENSPWKGVVAAAHGGRGVNSPQIAACRRVFLVLGNESRGLSPDTEAVLGLGAPRTSCANVHEVTIGMAGDPGQPLVESLNVATAGAILLHAYANAATGQ